MRYIHVRPTHGYIGLPMGDLTDTALTPEQQALLKLAVAAGVYSPEPEPEPVPEPPAKKAYKPTPKREDVKDEPASKDQSDQADTER